MNRYRKFAGLFLSMFLIGMLLAFPAFAAENIDVNAGSSLTISCQDDGEAIAGVEFDLYLVAEMDASGELSTVDEFARLPVNTHPDSDAALKTLASTLEGYVLRDHMNPVEHGVTDDHGSIIFPVMRQPLVPGMYLVLGSRCTQGDTTYDIQPVVVMLPGHNDATGEWDYQMLLNAKFLKRSITHGTVERKVLKVWEDKGHERKRPKEITVDLLCDGEVYDTVTLNAAIDWRYKWTDLPDENCWRVVERAVEGYTVETTREGITFIVKNIYDGPDTPHNPGGPGDSDEPDNPGTPGSPDSPGETSEIDESDVPRTSIFDDLIPLAGLDKLPQTGQLWWPVPILLVMGLMMMLIGLMRRRGILR